MIDYPYILRRAWQMLWKQPGLWLFGLLAGLTGLPRFQFDLSGAIELLPDPAEERVVAFVSGPYLPLVVVLVVLLLLAVGLVSLVLNALGRGGLVQQANEIENGRALSMRDGWRAARRRLWPLFWLVLLLILPTFLATTTGFIPYFVSAYRFYLPFAPPGAPAPILQTLTTFFACLLPGACLGLLLALPTRLFLRLAVCACVLEERSAWGSLGRAWAIVRRHPAPVLLLWLVMAAVTVGFVLPTVGLVVVAVWGMGTITAALVSRDLAVVLGGMAVSSTVASVAGLLVNGVAEVFYSACWTVAYRELTGTGRTGEEEMKPRMHTDGHGLSSVEVVVPP